MTIFLIIQSRNFTKNIFKTCTNKSTKINFVKMIFKEKIIWVIKFSEKKSFWDRWSTNFLDHSSRNRYEDLLLGDIEIPKKSEYLEIPGKMLKNKCLFSVTMCWASWWLKASFISIETRTKQSKGYLWLIETQKSDNFTKCNCIWKGTYW